MTSGSAGPREDIPRASHLGPARSRPSPATKVSPPRTGAGKSLLSSPGSVRWPPRPCSQPSVSSPSGPRPPPGLTTFLNFPQPAVSHVGWLLGRGGSTWPCSHVGFTPAHPSPAWHHGPVRASTEAWNGGHFPPAGPMEGGVCARAQPRPGPGSSLAVKAASPSRALSQEGGPCVQWASLLASAHRRLTLPSNSATPSLRPLLPWTQLRPGPSGWEGLCGH